MEMNKEDIKRDKDIGKTMIMNQNHKQATEEIQEGIIEIKLIESKVGTKTEI